MTEQGHLPGQTENPWKLIFRLPLPVIIQPTPADFTKNHENGSEIVLQIEGPSRNPRRG